MDVVSHSRVFANAGPGSSSGSATLHVMNRWFDPATAHAVQRSVALRAEVYALNGVTGEPCVIGG
jgi:hypothetical protein